MFCTSHNRGHMQIQSTSCIKGCCWPTLWVVWKLKPVVEAFKDEVNSSVHISFASWFYKSFCSFWAHWWGGGAGVGYVDDVCGDGNLLSPNICSDTTP
jgi:hypothetical protein